MPTKLKLDVVKEPDFLIEETDSQIVITGTTFTMPKFGDSVLATKHLTIRAYHVTLTDNILAPGNHVAILARKITVSDPIIISTAGQHASDWSIAANNGRTAGANGTPGRPGRSGGAGGKILLACEELDGMFLTLDASGGNGGKGETGGSGAQGANGRNGDDSTRGIGNNPGERGHDGGKGGDAGAGGPGGKGGDAGTIELHIPFDPQEHGMNLIVAPGKGGQPGANGQPGTGGLPGRGGLGQYCWERFPLEPDIHHPFFR